MDKATRNAIERATQRLRTLLEEDFAAQLFADFDVDPRGGWAEQAGRHLSSQRALQRAKIVAALEHKRAAGMSAADSVADYLRDAAFTALNRFGALKMLEARELVQECVTRGEQSSGYREFCGLAPGVALLPDAAGYRLYIESLFDELSTEVKVLFDRRDPASVLWPKRATFEALLSILNASELAPVWREDETIGWVYQYFNGSDERRKMREESQAPRNSRELAVRNQFFTPRYVVQFLTDNTLGRIWYEMRAAKTALAERGEYLVRRPGETFAPREKKDPRDLKVLDPACGSGHFLLYAFELLVTIYEEAHADPQSPKSEATDRTLQEDYPTLEALRHALPGLILAHNLHGVDIDARCAQIAQLALWMRAQRAYRDFGIKREDRPRIRKSNIVVAEPLVTDDRLTEEFVVRLGDEALGRVFGELVGALKLAGDLGILLRVENLLTRASESGQIDYIESPEPRIREALRRFVAEEGTRLTTRKRLFADDAIQGLGLLETAEEKFDVVLMNPPFGAGSTRAKKDFDRAYPRTKNDVYAAFVERGIELLLSRGCLGAITSRTGFFLSSFQKWREEVLLEGDNLLVFADLGEGVMDGANVEAAAYCIEAAGSPQHFRPRTVFLDCRHTNDKANSFRHAVRDPALESTTRRYELHPSVFRSVPGSAFVYQAPEALLTLAAAGGNLLSLGAKAQQGFGASTRFHRLLWEVRETDIGSENRWMFLVHGTKPAPFYKSTTHVVLWEDSGREAKADVIGRYPYLNGNYGFKIQAEADYGRPGLCYGKRTTQFTAQVMPAGHAFSFEGTAIHVRNDRADIWSLLALLNSRLVAAWLNLVCAQHKTYNYVDALPAPANISAELGTLARKAWSLQRSRDVINETSLAFVLPAELCARGGRFNSHAIDDAYSAVVRELEAGVNLLYGITVDDVERLYQAGNGVLSDEFSIGASADMEAKDAEDEEGDDPSEDELPEGVDTGATASWLVGVAFGRFDPRLATGERGVPSEPDPFDPLSARSPGMWPEGEAPKNPPDILLDDAGHAADLAARVNQIAERIGWEPPHDVRAWLSREFFPLHIKMYSKSRRKAPIYWQLATPSGSYSVWLYIHAFTKDTLFRVQHEYATPKLLHEEQRLESMHREFGENPARAERKQIDEQEAFVAELRAFLEEIQRIAPLWSPDLDDGVVINFAPLWRLVPQCKSWQKELKATWDALCAGEYDWAHLAMHLWPERVVAKCAKDRSLAIAHGLEDVFWVENSEGKWVARENPTGSLEDLVRERTSPAVKAALDSLFQAPVAQNRGRRSRGRRVRATGSA